MKHALVALVFAACNHGAPAPENAPPVASPRPAVAAARAPALPPPAPGCYTPTPADTHLVVADWSATFVGSDAPVDCSPGHDQAAIYCAHVRDGCCTSGGWTCNNARYVDWYAQQCGR